MLDLSWMRPRTRSPVPRANVVALDTAFMLLRSDHCLGTIDAPEPLPSEALDAHWQGHVVTICQETLSAFNLAADDEVFLISENIAGKLSSNRRPEDFKVLQGGCAKHLHASSGYLLKRLPSRRGAFVLISQNNSRIVTKIMYMDSRAFSWI